MITSIRPECYLPYSHGWIEPTGEEVKLILKLAGNLTGGAAAKLLGLREPRTIRRWTGGTTPIPYSAWAILCYEAGHGTIWTISTGNFSR